VQGTTLVIRPSRPKKGETNLTTCDISGVPCMAGRDNLSRTIQLAPAQLSLSSRSMPAKVHEPRIATGTRPIRNKARPQLQELCSLRYPKLQSVNLLRLFPHLCPLPNPASRLYGDKDNHSRRGQLAVSLNCLLACIRDSKDIQR
jgi:hypothetical protein